MKSYHDIVGDGGSGVLAQVEDLRARIAGRMGRIRHVVAIGSGKGGVGKSTLTVQLASALKATGRDVAVLDADLNGPSQARLAGVRDAVLVPGASGLAVPRAPEGFGVVSLGSVVPESVMVDFASVASGESHTWRATREFALLSELLAHLEWGALDLLLVDLPPGAERTFQYAEFFGPGAAFLLVTIPSDLSRGVVARSLAALRKTPNRVLGYVENMKGYCCPGCGTVQPLFPPAGEVDLGIPCLGSVPFDPDLAARCDLGLPALDGPPSPSSRAVGAIALALAAALETTP